MPSHDLEAMEETFLDQQELLVHNKQTAQEKMKGKRRLLKTAALSMAFFCLGLCVAIPGPTLLDLGRRVNRDTEHMTFIFTARSVGFLIGSLVGGVLFDFFDQQILLFYTLAVVAVATTGVPWCSVLLTLSSLICLQGVAIGVLDTGGNVFCIKIWGKRSAPFMQVLHFAFGIGAFLAPLIARPFLMDRNVSYNATIRGDHPFISIMSRSAHNVFVRDVSNMPFMEQSYTFNQNPFEVARVNSKTSVQLLKNHTQQSQINTLNQNIIPSWHENHFFNEKSRWKKKLDKKDGNNIFTFSVKNLNSTVYETGKSINVYETRTSLPSIMEKPKKPAFFNGEVLSQDHADDVSVDYKLKNLKSNLLQSNPEKGETTDEVTTTDIVLSKHETDDTTDEEDVNSVTIVRAKRQDSKVNETNNSKDEKTDNQLLGNKIGSNLTSTTVPSVITARPVKPGVIGGNLNGIYADGSKIDPQIKDLKDKHSKEENDKIKDVVTTVVHSLNMTTELPESENGTNVTQDWNNTGHISVPRMSRPTEKTTILPSTTNLIKTTTVPTTTPTTITTTTTTKSTRTNSATTSPSTRTNSATTLPSTESTTDQPTVITNTSSISKPTITGDLIRDLVTSLTGMSRIQIAYPVIGLLLAVNSGFFLFLHCKDRALKSPLHIRRYQDPARNPYTKCFVASVVLLLFLFFLAYMGMEVTFGGLLATFAVYYPTDPWSPAQGASLTSLFWGCLAIGRGFSIFIARCFKPSSMIIINLGLTVLGALILSFGVPANPAALWVGTVTLGLGMSSLFPTAILWANSCYPLSGSATAVFVAGCGVGEMTVPILTGYLYENVTHMAVMYVILFLSCLLSVLYVSIQMLVYRKGKMSQQRSNSGFVRLKNVEEVEEESDMGVVEGINLGIMETTWRRRVQGEEEKRGEVGGKQIMEFTKLMEM